MSDFVGQLGARRSVRYRVAVHRTDEQLVAFAMLVFGAFTG